METPITQTNQVPADISQQDLDDMTALEDRFDVAMEVAKLHDIVQKIEAEGTPEMKAKLKPYMEHYDGQVMTLITKRTKQNFDNDVWQDVSQAGNEAKAKYRQDPDGYLSEEKRAEYWQHAFDKTVDEARKLTQNLEQVSQSANKSASSDSKDDKQTTQAPRRRLFNR